MLHETKPTTADGPQREGKRIGSRRRPRGARPNPRRGRKGTDVPQPSTRRRPAPGRRRAPAESGRRRQVARRRRRHIRSAGSARCCRLPEGVEPAAGWRVRPPPGTTPPPIRKSTGIAPVTDRAQIDRPRTCRRATHGGWWCRRPRLPTDGDDHRRRRPRSSSSRRPRGKVVLVSSTTPRCGCSYVSSASAADVGSGGTGRRPRPGTTTSPAAATIDATTCGGVGVPSSFRSRVHPPGDRRPSRERHARSMCCAGTDDVESRLRHADGR